MANQTPPSLTSSVSSGLWLKEIRSETWHDFIAGCAGGTVGLVFGYPFDTIKVRQQTWLTVGPAAAAAPSSNGTAVQAVSQAFHRYAPRTLYRGMAFPLASEGLRNSLFFGLYGEILDYQSSHVSINDQGVSTSVKSREPTYGQVALAGAVAGAIQGVFATPIELVKVVLQSNNGSRSYHGPLDCLRKLYACHGTQGLFKGFHITVIREVPALSTYMVSYRYLQNLFKGEGRDQPTLAADLLAGGFAGVASWSMNMPVDVIKSRIQSDDPLRPRYNGILDCCLKSYREEGWRIFWRGLTITCVRAFPTNAVTLVVYSKSLRFLRGDDNAHTGSM